jgi:hypothetical protein
MKAMFKLLTIATAFLSSNCFGGVHQEWVNRYNLLPNKTNQAIKIALSADGNIVVGGSSANTNDNLDYLVIKYVPGGTQAWLTRYDSTNGNDLLRGIAVDKTGNVVLTGTSKTTMLSINGNLLWDAPYSGRGVAVGTNADVYVTGFSEIDFATAKLNGTTGSNVWTRTYDATGTTDVAQVIHVDKSENVFISGFETYLCDQSGCYRVVGTFKYSANGTVIWHTNMYQASIGHEADAIGIVSDQNGDIYVMGDNPFSYHYSATKLLGANGNQLWFYYLDVGNGRHVIAEGKSMTIDRWGNTYITGNDQNTICCTVKLNTNGTKAWISEYSGSIGGKNVGCAITLDSAGNVYVTGYSPGTGTGKDIITIKYDNNGTQLWVQRYDGPAHGDDIATGIVVDNETNIYVTGYSATTNGGTEFVTIQYSQKPNLKIQKQSNGSMRLQMLADAGQTWTFQTTTNFLQDWQTIGSAATDTNGVAELLDTNMPAFPARFYRGISPPP